MALLVNGTEPNNVTVNGSDIQTITVNGTVVWEAYNGPPSPVIITSSGTYVAGVDFPANTPILVEVLGGGGGGGGSYGFFSGEGGKASALQSSTITFNPGDSISATVGSGGSGGALNTAGGSGGSSSFSTVSASGGAGGRSLDNWDCGGQDSVWGNGGACNATGGVGAGGGGGTQPYAGKAGGRGEIRLSW